MEHIAKPLTTSQRETLEALRKDYKNWHLGDWLALFVTTGGAFLLGVFLLGFPLAVANSCSTATPDKTGLCLFMPGAIMVIPGLLIHVCHLHRRKKKYCRNLEKDLAGGQQDVLCGKVKDIYVLEAWDSQGEAFFIELDSSDHILFLQGAFLQENDFPKETITLSRLCHSKHILSLECTGEDITPSQVIPARDFSAPLPINGTVFPGNLDDLEGALWRWKEKQPCPFSTLCSEKEA